jgi:hypothetical protein
MSLVAQRHGQLQRDCSSFLSNKMNQARRRAMAGINCTLKTNDVCSEFLQNSVPVLEGVPSTPAISYIDMEGARAHGWY